ncbi:tRNA dimethylallyltransferase-like [Pomacea canaliculata]|uniref:tRNA dimethylallyltransferase-like n=1 Tax=Pomacea canaliculata TaxID=400727 RepID=UPI000D72ECD6|nr:tRNA dimethylallyltransferase-like [Pomacea canaliculata]
MMATFRRIPLVVAVVGATGTGKSKIGIELGRYFQGEIISADSMQMYQGLDVITNKVTAAEQALCPHHLISVLSPLSSNNTVTHFRSVALPIIDRLLGESKLPIIVGGTNYYIEALLWNFLIDKEGKGQEASLKAPVLSSEDESENMENEDCLRKQKWAKREKEGKYADYDSNQLYTLLQKVDPDSAKRLHPKNRRKVVRALQVYDEHGIPMSDIHQAQHKNGNTPGLSGSLRYPHCCIFWMECEQRVLDERLDKRVDEMVANGLVSELCQLQSDYLESVKMQGGEPDYTLGIFQSIGFKEFHDYLTLPADQKELLLDKSVQALKLATRQYARRQLKWIKNRFVHRPGTQVPSVYALDTTDPSQWDEKVFKPAVEVVKAALRGEKPSVQPLTPVTDKSTVHVHNICEVCGGRVFVTLHEWQEHLQSKRHKKMMWRKKEREGTQFTSQENVTVKSLAAANDVWRDTQEYKS